MQDYNAFIKNTTHFQPRLIIEIGGVDVSHRLIEGHSVRTDSLLDTPIYNVYTTSPASFCLNNSDNEFNTKNDVNFFTRLGRKSDGWQTPVKISVVFDNLEAPEIVRETPRVLFVGYIEKIEELRKPRWVDILVLDKSGLLQRALVDDFGVQVKTNIGGKKDASDYSSVNPVFDLPLRSAPISRGSVEVKIGETDIEILPDIPLAGRYASYRNASVNFETGQLFFGGEPPNKIDTRMNVSFKAAYRYRTPEALVALLLDKSGIYDDLTFDEKNFAQTLLKSPVLEHDDPDWSSHGRPQFGESILVAPVARWIESDLSGFYFGGDRYLLRYQRRNEATGVLDDYELLGACPELDANILQFKKYRDDEGHDVFYVLTVNDWSGRRAKIWKVTNALASDQTVWTEIPNTDATASHFYDYATRKGGVASQVIAVADNRKNFCIHGDFLYYVFLEGTSTGIRRLDLATLDLISDPKVVNYETLDSWNVGVNRFETSEMSWDFWVEGSMLYTFHCRRLSELNAVSTVVTNYLKVYRVDLSGSSPSSPDEIFSESLTKGADWKMRMVSDVVFVSGSLYFVLTYSRNLAVEGFSELCKLDISDPMSVSREVLDIPHPFDDDADESRRESRLGVRGLVEHDNKVYFVTGTWLSGIEGLVDFSYPTFGDSGNLYSISPSADPMIPDDVEDLGPVWRASRAVGGIGQYTAFCSNLHRSDVDGNLHVIGGYGVLANPRLDSIQSTDILDSQVSSISNFMWLQYGKALSGKIPVFPTNGRTVWELLEELSVTCDFEVGFTSGQDEIEIFKQTYPHLRLDEKGYFFFRPRVFRHSGISLDERDIVGVSSELDTLLVFNYVSVPVGDGVWIREDEREGSVGDPVRAFPVPSRLLGSENSFWAQLIADRILEEQQDPLLKVKLPLKFMPQIQRGQLIDLTSEYHSFETVPFRIIQVMHDTNSWQTTIVAREVDDLLRLPLVDDIRLDLKENDSGFLFEAMGGNPGDAGYTYELKRKYPFEGSFDLPAWFTFDPATREWNYTGSTFSDRLGTLDLVYRVTDSSMPEMKYEREFSLTVWGLTLPHIGEIVLEVDDKFVLLLPGGSLENLPAGFVDVNGNVDYVLVTLPEVVGVSLDENDNVLHYTYELEFAPSWLTSVGGSRYTGVAEKGTFGLSYRVKESEIHRGFNLIVSDPLPDKQGVGLAVELSADERHYLVGNEKVWEYTRAGQRSDEMEISIPVFSSDSGLSMKSLELSIVQDVTFVDNDLLVLIRRSSGMRLASDGTSFVLEDLDRSSSVLQGISLSGTEVFAKDLDSDTSGNSVRMSDEPPGDWRGVAYYNGVIYVMNRFGAIRTYDRAGDENPSVSFSLDDSALNLDADWESISFAVDENDVTFLTLAKNFPIVLGWYLPQPGLLVARKFEKDVVLSETDLNWTGIAVNASGDLLACREDALGFSRFDR